MPLPWYKRGTRNKVRKNERGSTSVLLPGTMDLDRAAEGLNQLSHSERLAVVRSLGKAPQAALFEAAKGRVITIADVVPADAAPLKPVIHHGKNSLPLFTEFQKRFCRSSDSPETELWGYNHQTMAPITGPGYYVAHQHGDEVAIDYTRLPDGKPESGRQSNPMVRVSHDWFIST